MTELILLTGFLGAGKTTLLNRLLATLSSRSVAVLSNDFGTIDVDLELIETDGPAIAVSGGSMFCACKQHELIEGLRALHDHSPEILLVEASGVGDPVNLGSLVTEANAFWPELTYRGAIGVVDLEVVVDMADLLPAVVRQITYSDVIVANKTDLVEPAQRDEALALLRRLNPVAQIVLAMHCAADVDGLLEPLTGLPRVPEETTNSVSARLPALTLTTTEDVPTDALRAFLSDVAPGAYRIKGTLASDHGYARVSCVGAHTSVLAHAESPTRTGLAMIFPATEFSAATVIAAWERHVGLSVQVA